MKYFAVSKVFFIFVFSKCMVKNSVIATRSAYYRNNIYIYSDAKTLFQNHKCYDNTIAARICQHMPDK